MDNWLVVFNVGGGAELRVTMKSRGAEAALTEACAFAEMELGIKRERLWVLSVSRARRA